MEHGNLLILLNRPTHGDELNIGKAYQNMGINNSAQPKSKEGELLREGLIFDQRKTQYKTTSFS